MTARVFVDSNVLIYTRDFRDLRKRARARDWVAALWSRNIAAVSPQVLNEFYNIATTKLAPGLDRNIARRDVNRYLRWHVVSPDRLLYDLAFDTQDRWRFSWWDSLIVAAARRGACTHLLSEDLTHGQDLGGIAVVSPFLTDPKTLVPS